MNTHYSLKHQAAVTGVDFCLDQSYSGVGHSTMYGLDSVLLFIAQYRSGIVLVLLYSGDGNDINHIKELVHSTLD